VTHDFVRELSDAKAEKEGWYDMYMMAKNETGQANAEIARLTAERDEVRTILAGTDINSLPYDYPTSRMAQKRMDDREKFMWQVRDTCTRAETAEKERDEAKAEIARLHKALAYARSLIGPEELLDAALKPDTGETKAVHQWRYTGSTDWRDGVPPTHLTDDHDVQRRTLYALKPDTVE